MAKLREVLTPAVYDKGASRKPSSFLSDMTLAGSFEEFLTLPAYELVA